jgi:N utilization substance protein A
VREAGARHGLQRVHRTRERSRECHGQAASKGPDYIFDVGKAEARMPRKEQSRLESFAVGERVRVVIVQGGEGDQGPGVIVSRAAPELVQHLFQTEVPEIYDNTVVIRAIAREAGERTKIAVMSATRTWTPSAPASA